MMKSQLTGLLFRQLCFPKKASNVNRLVRLNSHAFSGNLNVRMISCLHDHHVFLNMNVSKLLTIKPNHNISHYQSCKYSSKSDDNNNDGDVDGHKTETKMTPSFDDKYKPFKDEDSRVIFDVTEEMMRVKEVPEEDEVFLYQDKKKRNKLDFFDSRRGKTGVFDVDQLVDLLRSEKMTDIAVIEVPKELKYADYLVLANGNSPKHLSAVLEFIKKVYKKKKNKRDPFLTECRRECKEWQVFDMKNIVLHLFIKETREYYDIETLWTVGEEFDDKSQRPEVDPVVDIMEKHIKYLQEIQPAN